MEPFTVLNGIAAPMPLTNVNTDDIYPASGLNPALRNNPAALRSRDQLGLNAFGVWRWQKDGTPRHDFVLNRPPFDAAQILLAFENFGCGSSREMAVWALVGTGIRCVVAPSFGDIFYGNCFKNGMLPVRLPHETVTALIEMAEAATAADPSAATVSVDLERQLVTAPDDSVHAFDVEPYRRQLLLEGLDEVAATMQRQEQITRFETEYAARRPWVTEVRLGPRPR